MANAQQVQQLICDTGALLRFQAELGLRGLDVPEDLLSPRRSPIDSIPSSPATALTELAEALVDCRRCQLSQSRQQVVFGTGAPSARLLFVGGCPSQDEDRQGEPFVGAAGQLLDRMIAAMGTSRGDTYTVHLVKCSPPQNRGPEPEEISACEPFLKRQIEIVQPEAIVTLGRGPAQILLRSHEPISRLRGRWQQYAGIPLMPTFAPADLLRNADHKRAAWQDLQQVMKKLGLEDPRRRA